MAQPGDPLVVYSDYVCPFCYLGKVSLDRYRASVPDPPPVRWRPFDLRAHKRTSDHRIDTEAPDWKDDAYYERARQNVERLADEYGVEMALGIALEVDAWNAHKATLWMERGHGKATVDAFRDAVFQALWVHGRDIGSPDVLTELADAVGADPSALARALEDPALDEALEEAFRDAQRAGISAVPTFTYGQLAVPGALPPEHLAKLVENG